MRGVVCSGLLFVWELFFSSKLFFCRSCSLNRVVFFVEVLCAALFFARELFFYARSCLLRSYCLREELFFRRKSCFLCGELFAPGVIVCARSYSLRERVVSLREELFARKLLSARELFAPSRQHFAG